MKIDSATTISAIRSLLNSYEPHKNLVDLDKGTTKVCQDYHERKSNVYVRRDNRT